MQEQNDQLYDIYGMVHVPFWQTTAFYVVVGILAGLVVGVIGWRLIRYWRLRARPALPPWEQALIALNKLCDKEVMTSDRSKEFYDRLTMILKQYLHDRYAYDVMGKTDQELLVYLESVSFDAALTEIIRNLLQGSVMIKFANAQGAREQMERDIASSIIVIKKTVPLVHKRQ